MAALPYGIGTLGVATVGIITCIAASSTIALIMGVALAVLGGYAFLGVLTCGFASGGPSEYHSNVWKHMATGAGAGIADIAVLVAKAVILKAIFGRD